jgi:hypothetical protein
MRHASSEAAKDKVFKQQVRPLLLKAAFSI